MTTGSASVRIGTKVQGLAAFAVGARWEDVSHAAAAALKARVLDALGCGLGALSAPPVRTVRRLTASLGGEPSATLIGGGKTAPDRAAFFNGAAIRYLDFNDAYLAPYETCHPSDNVAPLLAAAEYAHASGSDFLTALAVAYQVQCRLSDVAPVRAKGFDHTVQGVYSSAAGAARAMGLPRTEAAHAIAIAGTGNNALRVTRTGELSNWKGLAFPHAAMNAVHAALLARWGITGPLEVFEGNKGLEDAITGPFTIDWAHEDLSRVTQTITKRFNAEIHAQSAIEALLTLRRQTGLPASALEAIELDTFQVAFQIIGGGEEGGKKLVRTKEEADHSLPYMLAAAYLDGELTPAQYRDERIAQGDVQDLLQRVDVRPDPAYSARFPQEMACQVTLRARDGRSFTIEQRDYEGFTTRPVTWEQTVRKFRALARGVDPDLAQRIIDAVSRLEDLWITDLTSLLAEVRIPEEE
ncbi:MAG: MmgE/PrpD family protein [Thermaerobacter sp.]|nr:MmgE/PrpD family protein [Thermaerobacter sp.]